MADLVQIVVEVVAVALAGQAIERVLAVKTRTAIAQQRLPKEVRGHLGRARQHEVEGNRDVDALVETAFAELFRGNVGEGCISAEADGSVFATVIPSKIFEAMGMGVPLLMSLPEGEATAIVREAGAGVCVRPEDSEAMADELVKLDDNPGLVRDLGRQARASAQRFSRNTLAEQMLHVLLQVAHARACELPLRKSVSATSAQPGDTTERKSA